MPKRASSSPLQLPKTKKSCSTETSPSSKAITRNVKGLNSRLDLRDEGKNSEEMEACEIPLKMFKGDRTLPELKKLKCMYFEFFAQVDDGALDNNYSTVVTKIRELGQHLDEEDIVERKSATDQLMREFVLECILKQNQCSWHNFLELGIKLARDEICNPSILFTLISDLVELSALKDCQHIFDFVEKHLEIWKEPLFLNSGKNAVLRMCNDLLRRLSRAQNTIFCGRILIFLSNYFPFSERSGLNIMSEFNNENITVYKSDDGSDDPDDKMDVTDDKPEKLFEGVDVNIPGLDKIIVLSQEEKKNKMKVDYNLYVKFWSLQEFFRDPLRCYSKIVWKTFTMYTNDVLTAFGFFKMEDASKLKKKKLKVRRSIEDMSFLPNSSVNDIPRLSDESLYFAKYLTNRRLLELQMYDSSFRRYFMVQLLIILQYLTVNVKFKTDGQVLSEEQQEFVKKTTERVYNLLEDTPPAGKPFVNAVKHVLAREHLWNQWKNDGCPAFKKPTASSATLVSDSAQLSAKDDKIDTDEERATKSTGKSTKGKKIDQEEEINRQIEEAGKMPRKKKHRHLGDTIADAAENDRFLMGNAELTRLWNICGDNLEACRSRQRDFLPTIDAYFADAFKELDHGEPSEGKKDKKILENSNYGWRGLRLLAKKSSYFFQLFGGAPVHPLQKYLETILVKIMAEKETPQQLSTPERLEKSQDSKEDNVENGSETKKREDDQDAEMEGEVEEDEEIMNEVNHESDDDEEEGEVDDKDKVKIISETEIRTLGKALGPSWKKLAPRLGFQPDEIQYFEENQGEEAGPYMLQRWKDNEGDEAVVADLLYILEGLGLKEIGDSVFQ